MGMEAAGGVREGGSGWWVAGGLEVEGWRGGGVEGWRGGGVEGWRGGGVEGWRGGGVEGRQGVAGRDAKKESRSSWKAATYLKAT